MAVLTFSRRLQLVKLLRTRGLRDVERMREDELKQALAHLAEIAPQELAMTDSPSSSELMRAHAAFPATPPPALDDDADDPHALPRFREPKLSLPEHARTFLRAIAVKPGLLFVTWDVDDDVRASLRGPAQIWIHAADYLGAPPEARALFDAPPALRIDVELSAGGWYVPLARERAALAAALVAVEEPPRTIARSNVALTPPSTVALPGPYWSATLPPSVDRRRLGRGALLQGLDGGALPEGASIVAKGEIAGGHVAESDLPASARAYRRAASSSNPSSSSSARGGS